MSGHQVQYLFDSSNGHLNILPSGNTVYIDKDDTTAKLVTANIDVNKIDINSGSAVFTNNDLTGSITLNSSGTINGSANTITGLTDLSSSKIQSGDVIIQNNNLSAVSLFTSKPDVASKITSNNFKVESAITGGSTVTTMTSDVVQLAAGTTINDVSITTTGLTVTSITSGNLTVASNNLTTTSGTLSAVEVKDASGNAKMTGGIVTATTGNVATVHSTDVNVADTATVGTLTDSTIQITGGTLSNATTITGTAITMTSGIVGFNTLTGSSAATSQIQTSKLVLGPGTIATAASVASLTGFNTVSSSTLTTSNGTDIINGNITTSVISCGTSITVPTATFGAISVTANKITLVDEVSSTKFTSGDIEMSTVGSGDAAIHKLTGLDSITSGTITTVAGMVIDGKSVSGVDNLTATNSTLATITSSKIISGSSNLQSNNFTGLNSVISETLKTKTAGGIEITSASDAHSISGVKALSIAAGGVITCGNVTITKDTDVIDGLSSATITSSLKVGNVAVSSDNISSVSHLGCSTTTATGNVTAGTFTSNNFLVSHAADTSTTTTKASVFTTSTSVGGTDGITITKTDMTGISNISTGTLVTSGLATIESLNVTNATTVGGLLTTSANIANTGSITSTGKIVGSYFEASDSSGTSTIKGSLRVEGDLKVINDTAKVIELTHEKFSTQDPVIEFNKVLDGTAPSKAGMNVDFGFINVCYDGANKVSSGVLGNVGGEANDVVFKFFHSGTYTTGGVNDTVPGTFDYAPIACNNITSDGTLQIGSVAPAGNEKIRADGDIKCTNLTTTADITSGGKLILTSAGDTISSAGKITTVSLTTQNFTQTSDRRKKENIQPIDDALSNIEKLNPVTFDWKDSKQSDVGFIAQEVREVFPELVQESSEGQLSVAYTGIVSPLVRAIQQQQEMIRKLEERLAKLE